MNVRDCVLEDKTQYRGNCMEFYLLDEQIRKVDIDHLEPGVLTVAYLSSQELLEQYERFDFDIETVEDCQKANPLFRTGAEVHDSYTFTEIRVVTDGDDNDDWIALYLKKDFIMLVDIKDDDGSTRDAFFKTINRFPAHKRKTEKLVCAFLEELISPGKRVVEKIHNEISEMEEEILDEETGDDFAKDLLLLKRRFLKQHNYYEQILDVAEILDENENDIFEEDNLIYVSNLIAKITRLRDDFDSMNSAVDHLQDAYSSYFDTKMNRKMNILTVITTLFFPLTIIVGWYGMNFVNMPELTWKHGYLYVVILSLLVVSVMAIIAKKKKWY